MRAIAGLVVCLAFAATRMLAAEPQAHSGNAKQSSNTRKPAAKPLSGRTVDGHGDPIAGADVVYSFWIGTKNQTVASKSDDQGRFTLPPPEALGGDTWPPGEIWAGVAGRRVAHDALFREGRPRAEDIRLVLQPAAHLSVRVVGPDGKPVQGAQLVLPMVASHEGLVPDLLLRSTQVTTNANGEAIVTAFDREELSEVRVTSPGHGTQSKHLTQEARSTDQSLVVLLRSAGRVHGRLVATESVPVDGIRVSLMSFPGDAAPAAGGTIGEASATTDKAGQFEMTVAEGIIRYTHVDSKPGLAFLPDPPQGIALTGGQSVEIEIPYRRAVQVRGRVRQTGKPLADVAVNMFRDGAGTASAATTNADGRFDFLVVPGPYNLYVLSLPTHVVPGWFGQRRFEVSAEVSDFELPPIDLVIARGRVVDDLGRGVAGAKIEKAQMKFELHGQVFDSQAYWYSEPQELSTDVNGEYRAWVEAGCPYRALIHVEGRAPQWTAWTEFGGDQPAAFPDVVIESLKSVAGRVVDRQDRPLAGVTITQSGDGPRRTKTTTDGEGRFELTGYQNASGYVFAEKPGFRFRGQAVKAGDKDVRMMLARTSDPPERRLATLPEADPKGDDALAMRVMAPALDRLMKEEDERERRVVLRDLVTIDPGMALDRLEALGVKGDTADMIRVEVAKAWSVEHPDDAMAIIEALDDPYSHAVGYFMAAEAMPASLRERKIDWLAKARVHLRAAADPTIRAALATAIARMLYESGEKEEAAKLIAEIKPVVEEMPLDGFSGYVRGVTAEALASGDLPAALALIKDLRDDSGYDRHHGNVARLIAATRPVDALRVLKLVRDDFQRDQHAVYVAHLAAPVDHERAREAAEAIANPGLRALAEGWMAEGLGKSDAKAAAAQLDRAYGALEKLAEGEKQPMFGYHTAPVLAAWFLPIVEAIQPDHLDEYLWRSLSLRLPLAKQGERAETVIATRAYLAMFVARYDRELARELLADSIAETGRGPTEYSLTVEGWYATAAVIDAGGAVVEYEKLADDSPFKSQARSALVGILSKHGEERWRAASDHLRMPMPWHKIQ
jgi:hypothetical protein